MNGCSPDYFYKLFLPGTQQKRSAWKGWCPDSKLCSMPHRFGEKIAPLASKLERGGVSG